MPRRAETGGFCGFCGLASSHGDDGEKNSNFKPLRFGLSGRPLAGYQGSSPHFIGQKLGPNDFKPQPGVLEPLS